jgi:hypothetical protein
MIKDVAHYMKAAYVNGSKEEIEAKCIGRHPDKQMAIEYGIKYPKYIIFDFECDTHTNIHKPNHVEVAILEVHKTHSYEQSLEEWKTFEGYGCENKFCEWLFSDENNGATVMAHNGAGYDNKFILKWCLEHGMHKPEPYIRQGSRITYMYFDRFHLRFIDTYHFLLQPLRKLPETYGVDCEKGHFPHLFNTPKNQNYIGPIPKEKEFGVMNMDKKYYEEDFKPWYDEQVKLNRPWHFKHEMQHYCKLDVEVLAKTVLKFRKLFLDDLDVDPFRYTTLSSLCMSIFTNKLMKDKTIVANATNKKDSIVCREWLKHLNDDRLIPEIPIVIKKDELALGDKQFKHYKNNKS